MRNRNWKPSTPLGAVLRRVIAREKAAIERRKRCSCASEGLESLESRMMMSAVHAVPTIPTSISAKVQGPTSIQLNWTDKDTSISGYYVLRSTGGASFTQVGQIKSRTTTFTDTKLTSDTVYSYEIQAYNTTGSSAVSSVFSVTTPLVSPSALTASVQSTTTSQLNWTDNDTKATGYYVLRSADGIHFSQIANLTSATAVTFTDTGLTSGHAYAYEVEAYAGIVTSAASKPASAITPLAAPSRLSAVAQSSTVVGLTWADNDASAVGYYVLRSTDAVHYSQPTKIASPTAVSYTDKTTSSLKKFYYEVEAYSAATTSAASDPASASTPLTIPSALAGLATSANSVKLTWTDTDPAALGYYILRGTDGTHFTQISALTSGRTTTYTDSTASSNRSYQYEIEAYSGTNTSLASAIVIVTTPVAAPSALTATAQNVTTVQLHWTDNDSSATGYNLLRSTDGVHYIPLGTLSSGGATSYTDSTAISGHAYNYEVQAVAGTSLSAMSIATTATTPLAAASGLSATAQSSTSVLLGWTDNDTSAIGYNVLRSTDGTHFTKLTQVSGSSANSFTDTTASSLGTFYYEIQAYSAATTSAASGAISTTTPLSIPSAFVATAAGATSVKLTWTDPDVQAMGYYVLRANGGSGFSQVGQVTSGRANTYTDSTAASDTAYQYEVKAYNGSNASLQSNVTLVMTPVAAPSVLTATAVNGTSVQLQWTDNDSTATGYNVLRSTDNVHFSQIGTISSPDATGYTDNTVASGHAYSYEVNAFSGSNISAVSTAATVTTPLGAPTGLTATAPTATNVQLTWTDNDSSATGYSVLRSTDGSTFTLLVKITTATATSYTDTTASSAKQYYYRVQAYDTTAASAVSNTASATTPMFAPTGLTGTQVGAYVNLMWINQDPTTTAYILSRSTDGTNFTQLTQLNSPGSTTYADTTATVGQKYYYEVQATNGTLVSHISNVVNVTPIDTGSGSVNVTTRHGSELVITATGADDSVSLAQSGSILTVSADGQTYSEPVPVAGLFVYTRGGSDGINIASSVTIRTTLETIDGALTDITSAGANVSAWIDSTDLFTGTGAVNKVASFAGGVGKAAGVSLKDPSDSGAITHFSGSLWGSGPVAGDINQGSVGDCYFLSSLAAFAGEKPGVLMQSAVDMGDGTYTVQFYSGANPVDVRVSNDMPLGGFNGYAFAHPGANGTGWAMVMEKAFAEFRTGANTYASISSGWMGTVYADLGVASNNFFPSNYTESAFYNMVSTDLASGKAVTLGTVTAPNLVSDHAYTLISASIDGNGVTHYVVRNPWGVSGDNLEDSNGYATLTFAQLKANFYDGCQAA